MDAIRVDGELRLASAPSALWPLLSNTNRLNRAAGLPEARVEPRNDFERTVRSRLAGWTVVWRERPFDYVADRGYTLVREFENGPLRRFEGGLTLTPDGTGTRALLRGAFTPRHALARGLVKLFAGKALREMTAVLKSVDASLVHVGERPALPRTATPADETLLAARARTLTADAEPAAAARLVAHLRSAPDDEVVRFRPFELADRWGLPRLDVLGASLHAVKAGLLDMRWDLLCPNCSAAPESLTKLSDLKSTAHCAGCALEYGVGFDESVELRFTVHPSVRDARVAVFCAGSPAHSPQAIAQQLLAAGETREIELDLAARSYRVRGLVGRRSVLLRPRDGAPGALDVDLGAVGNGAELSFRPGSVRLRLAAPAPDIVRVEAESWREAGATAALVTSLQEFRSLFSSEVLAPGLEIGVKRLALLFTDLKASTALYERVGDATAYGVVRDHFDYLTAIVAARRGAVVKTIGDAVMAVFASPADALEAALDMQERIGELDAKLAPRAPVVLKIGVHEGAAIAINASGVLDYFGTTANIAARVQGESEGGDIVVTDVLRDDPSARAVLARRAPPEEAFDSALKGLTGVHRLWRLRPRKKA
jgi:adenylate cyclase